MYSLLSLAFFSLNIVHLEFICILHVSVAHSFLLPMECHCLNLGNCQFGRILKKVTLNGHLQVLREHILPPFLSKYLANPILGTRTSGSGGKFAFIFIGNRTDFQSDCTINVALRGEAGRRENLV